MTFQADFVIRTLLSMNLKEFDLDSVMSHPHHKLTQLETIQALSYIEEKHLISPIGDTRWLSYLDVLYISEEKQHYKMLYKFQAASSKYHLRGIFLAAPLEIREQLGKVVYLNDGRATGIRVVLDPKQFELLSEDVAFNEKARRLGLIPQGVNPLE